MTHSFDELSVELTKKCALNCIYCSSDASICREEKLDLEKLKDTILQIKNKQWIKKISLSGGDPLLYSDFLNFFNFLRELKIKIIIYSSGVVLDHNDNIIPISQKMLKEIKISSENPKIHINIQGFDKQTIEKINGKPGSYDCIRQTILNIKAEKMFLGANVVPFKNNFRDIERIYDFCIENEFNQINFLRFVPQGRGKEGIFDLSRSDFYQVQKSLVRLLERPGTQQQKIKLRIGHPINFLFLLGKKDLYPQETKHCCRGGIDAPLILPDGTVAMCPAWKELTHFSPGNIYNKNFWLIWTSREFELFREFVNTGYKQLNSPCKICQYLEECKGKCVAQRLLDSSDDAKNTSFGEVYRYAPDPLCFKDLIKKD
jgi:radical SAM protein with 4Fe4S-binding SPASM domain